MNGSHIRPVLLLVRDVYFVERSEIEIGVIGESWRKGVCARYLVTIEYSFGGAEIQLHMYTRVETDLMKFKC